MMDKFCMLLRLIEEYNKVDYLVNSILLHKTPLSIEGIKSYTTLLYVGGDAIKLYVSIF